MRPQRVRQVRAVFEDGPDYCDANQRARFSSPAIVFKWLRGLADESRECFLALHLDTKNRLICLDVVSIGSLSASIVHPREVFKAALLSSAAAVVFVHNHPSGDPAPSREDRAMTHRLAAVGELLGVRVLDHIIIGTDGYTSLADLGEIGNG